MYFFKKLMASHNASLFLISDVTMIKALPSSRSRFGMNFCLLTKPQNKAVSAQAGAVDLVNLMLGNESSFREDGVGTEDLITTLMTCTKIACRNSVKIEVFPPCHNLCCVKCFTPITPVLGSNYTQFISSF